MLMHAALLGMALQAAAPSPPAPSVGAALADVRRFAAGEGERTWPGYGSAPFEFLLLEEKRESLLCRSAVPDGFAADGRDEPTGCQRFVRPRSGLSDKLLAAMPLFGPPPTIVMGTPASTGRTLASWLRTILHEHFHQWQFSLPDYFARTDALGLKGDDTTGMWVLNYAFPYERPGVVAAQAEASKALADAVAAVRTPGFYAAFDAYLAKRKAFERASGPVNWRYVEFQLWQEGAARWTEIRLGRAYPDEAVAKSAATLEERTLSELRAPDLAGSKREFVYAYGTAEAMLMEACGSGWRTRYAATLAMGPLLDEARRTCGRSG